MPNPPPRPPFSEADVQAFFARLVALHTGDQEGLFHYLAGDNRYGRYGLRLGSDRIRELERTEVLWWTIGHSDAYGQPDLITDAVTAHPAPELMTIADAAKVLGLTPDGVEYRIKAGQLYVVFPNPRQRRLVADQVRAQAGVSAAARRWAECRSWWPDGTRFKDLSDYTRPPARSAPTIATGPLSHRRWLALKALDTAGYLRFDRVDPVTDTYIVTVQSGNIEPRELPAVAVLPWALGVADRHDRPDLVAYREGLA